MKKIILILITSISFCSMIQAQENDIVFSFETPINIDLSDSSIADALFFIGGSRNGLNDDGIILNLAEERFERLRIDWGCENQRGRYYINYESRACIFKNNSGTYTLTGFIADKTIHAANDRALRNAHESFGVRGERYFIFNTLIGGEIGYREEIAKFAGKKFAERTSQYAAITILRPLEPRRSTARPLNLNTTTHDKMRQARKMQKDFLKKIEEAESSR